MKKLFARTPFTKDKVARRELAFAHVIIVLLSLSLWSVLTFLPFKLGDAVALVSAASLLLIVTAAISAAIVVSLMRTKK